MDKVEKRLYEVYEKAINDIPLSEEEALFLLGIDDTYVPLLVYLAGRVKEKFFPEKELEFCSIINAKSGACSEDCAFCAQSKHYKTPINIYNLVPEDELVEGAVRGAQLGANRYCIVLSGKKANEEEVERICSAVMRIKQEGIPVNVCVSAGTLEEESLKKLKEAGVKRVNHNLETSRSFFPRIVTTHTWDERYETIKRVKEAGLSTCSGGIFGMGESAKDRASLARARC